jgi:hypothetical protein
MFIGGLIRPESVAVTGRNSGQFEILFEGGENQGNL